MGLGGWNRIRIIGLRRPSGGSAFYNSRVYSFMSNVIDANYKSKIEMTKY